MAEREAGLTRSMEDYLEAIYNLKERTAVARVKDIAIELAVKMPSVTGAMKALAEKGLVKHRPYESVELTDEGLERARGVATKHAAIKGFLVNVLGLPEHNAEEEACGIEHAIRPDTLDKLLAFVEKSRVPGPDAACPGRHRGLGHRKHADAACGKRLSQMEAGTKGAIIGVCGRGPIGKRLLEMGLTPGAEFEVIRHAPLGDPVEIKIRGYLLSLRKSEAEHVEVSHEL